MCGIRLAALRSTGLENFTAVVQRLNTYATSQIQLQRVYEFDNLQSLSTIHTQFLELAHAVSEQHSA